MAKIPEPQPGGCIKYLGMTVCPHLVHLTPAQAKTVYNMHKQNVAEIKRREKDAAKRKKKVAKARGRSA
jgi:hypothetical protein